MAVPFKTIQLVAFAALLSAAVSCSSDEPGPAQLLVVVSSNWTPGRELAAVVLRVDGDERARIVLDAAESPTLPFSFGVTPPGGDVDAQVTIEATALSPEDEVMGCPARARVGFRAGEARRVMLALTRACGIGSCACDDTQTCVDGECSAAELDADALPRVEPGRELEGVTPPPDTTLGAPERVMCEPSNGAWSDIGRVLTRTHDDQLCPVMSDGTEWGSDGYPLDMNRQALSDYVDRHIEVGHDLITLQVAFVGDELRVSGRKTFDAQALRVPTLAEALQLPALAQADQPLQLVVREEDLVRSQLVSQLPRILLEAGVVRDCRPVYLTASGPVSFAALRELRDSIRAQPRWHSLWNLVHFARRLTAPTHDGALAELNEAVAHDFERVAIGAERVDLPALRRAARDVPIATQLYEANEFSKVASFCDGSTGVEALLWTERQPEIRYFDELRYMLSTARTLLELDVSGLDAGESSIPFRSLPELSMLRTLELGRAQPRLVTGDTGTLWGDVGTVLQFSAADEQSLSLADATYNELRPERKYFLLPQHVLMVTARLPTSTLMEGERQVLVSKLRGESGWALSYVNEGSGAAIQYQWYGRGREDNTVTLLSGALQVSALPMQVAAPLTIFVKNHLLAIGAEVAGIRATTPNTPINNHIMVTNDAPITLGADPDGGGYFDGDIQSVKVLVMYEGPEDF